MEEIKLPVGEMGKERIVGVTTFRGDVVIATEWRVLRMSQDEYNELVFTQIKSEPPIK